MFSIVESYGENDYLDGCVCYCFFTDFEEVVEICTRVAVKLHVGVVEGRYPVDV